MKKRTQMLTLVLANSKNYDYFQSCVVASKKKVGNAVLRNRAKRRVRELIRKYSNFLKPGDLLMAITTKAVCTSRYSDLENEFLYALKKLICREFNDCCKH